MLKGRHRRATTCRSEGWDIRVPTIVDSLLLISPPEGVSFDERGVLDSVLAGGHCEFVCEVAGQCEREENKGQDRKELSLAPGSDGPCARLIGRGVAAARPKTVVWVRNRPSEILITYAAAN
jgi:hypothetical protein